MMDSRNGPGIGCWFVLFVFVLIFFLLEAFSRL